MTEPVRTDWRALSILVFGAVVIGLAPILVRLTEAGPAAGGFWRLLLAAPVLAIMTRRASPGPATAVPKLALLAGVFFALDLGFWHYGIAYTSVAKATILTNLTPVVVTAFAWFFLKRPPRRLFLLAVGLAVAGAWIMAAAKGGGGRDSTLGDILSLATAFWYALYFLTVGEARRSEGAGRVMFWSTLTGAPLLLIAALAFREDILPASAAGWAACAGLAAVHVIGQGAIAWALGRLPTALTSVVVLIQPIVATLLGWILFQEALSAGQAAGAAITLAGVVLAQRAALPKPSQTGV